VQDAYAIDSRICPTCEIGKTSGTLMTHGVSV
jgi:hypothetical protein